MHIIVMSPHEDESFKEVLLVNKEGKTGEDFENEIQETREHLNKLNQEWEVDDLLQAQRAKGWQIMVAPYTSFTY